MSIVEKAAERLRHKNATSSPRLREDRPAPEETAPTDQPWADRPERSSNAPLVDGHLVLDEVRLRRVGMMPPESMDLWMTREFQRIKRPLLSRIKADEAGANEVPASRLMITSASPGEGKSFTAFNLALSLASELDHSVVLIDADVAKPGMTRNLELENEPGLIHLLKTPGAPADSCLIETDQPRLSILPSGRRSRDAVERLASQRMSDVLDDLGSDPSRILVLDSSPLLAAAESQALAVNAGQILMVVRAGKTERKAVTAALSLIEPAGSEISFILNQSHRLYDDRHAGYYGVYPGDTDSADER